MGWGIQGLQVMHFVWAANLFCLYVKFAGYGTFLSDLCRGHSFSGIMYTVTGLLKVLGGKFLRQWVRRENINTYSLKVYNHTWAWVCLSSWLFCRHQYAG